MKNCKKCSREMYEYVSGIHCEYCEDYCEGCETYKETSIETSSGDYICENCFFGMM